MPWDFSFILLYIFSSPEEESQNEEENKAKQEDEDMVLETAETLLALSGKNNAKMPKEFMNRTDTAVVLPQQPSEEAEGRHIFEIL